MRVEDFLAEEYLKGKDVSKYASEWYFEEEKRFENPPECEKTHKAVEKILNDIKMITKNFVPLNNDVVDILFPDRKNIQINVDLIVGYPAPYDAVVKKAPDGKTHIILDLVRIADYGLSENELKNVISNLLTHEGVHVLMAYSEPDIARAMEEDNYINKLDAIVFDEGFAHLLSYNNKELEQVDWTSQKLRTVFEQSSLKLNEAIKEQKPERQKELIIQSNTGGYYEKFGAMSGMLYLAGVWRANGAQGLLNELNAGCRGFVKRVLAKAKSV